MSAPSTSPRTPIDQTRDPHACRAMTPRAGDGDRSPRGYAEITMASRWPTSLDDGSQAVPDGPPQTPETQSVVRPTGMANTPSNRPGRRVAGVGPVRGCHGATDGADEGSEPDAAATPGAAVAAGAAAAQTGGTARRCAVHHHVSRGGRLALPETPSEEHPPMAPLSQVCEPVAIPRRGPSAAALAVGLFGLSFATALFTLSIFKLLSFFIMPSLFFDLLF